MNNTNQFAHKKRNVPGWIRTIPGWGILSWINQAYQHVIMSAAYWRRFHLLQTFKYFLAVVNEPTRYKFLNTFHFKEIEFDLRPMEWHLMDSILLKNEYEPISRLYNNEAPAIIIDAGANVGLFSIYAFSIWNSTKVLAVEPAQDTFKILEGNQQKNPTLDWHIFQYAFWEEDGMIAFETEGLSMAAHISPSETGARVPAIRLDHFIDKYLHKEERISVLKMDIEGAELAVLNASLAVLSRVDVLLIEIHGEMCDESAVREILHKEFPFNYDLVYELVSPGVYYTVALASRKPLEETFTA
ncbi:MAG: FkbM family methyltransferase [Chloroflexi bacterium]|nr:FkbM family methyltransferase [Chloroflexota bacterium]